MRQRAVVRPVTPEISLEILDLRHFTAALMKPLLDVEGSVWNERLNWDYRASARLLMQYLDSRMLPGYAALDTGRVVGYGFCVYEDTKAVIGDVFAQPQLGSSDHDPHAQTALEVEDMLLEHLLSTLQHSPQVDRIESQLLLHPSGRHGRVFRDGGFELYRRLFMVQPLGRFKPSGRGQPLAEIELRTWRDDDLSTAGRLISEAYEAHPDSLINDQYRSPHGSMRFLHNIVRYSGCGTFSPAVSHVAIERRTREMVGLVLGSRVSPHSGHITQLCVLPRYRRQGLGRLLLETAAGIFQRQGMTEVSLTVTEANARAIELYESEGYACRHTFDAAVWQRRRG